jgi:glycosyltransferase involved in cell wall biosynthesis
MRRVPVVYTEHNRWAQYHPLTRWANRLTYPLDTRQFAVSEGVRASIDGVLRRRVEVLHHGIDLSNRPEASETSRVRDELGFSGEEFVVVVVANLREEKAPITFLEAVKRYEAPCPTRFIWVGQGPLEEAFRQQIRDLDLEARVSYLGYRSDVAAVLSVASVFTLSSDHEGLPVALMEALSAGLPIIATAVGGLPEVVCREPRAGLLVPPREPEQLARAWESVAADRQLLQALSDNALGRAQEFDAQRFVDYLADVYRELA